MLLMTVGADTQVMVTFGRGSGQNEVIVSFLHHLHLEQRLPLLLLDVAHVLTASAEHEQRAIRPTNHC